MGSPVKFYLRAQWTPKIREFVMYFCGWTLQHLCGALENSHGEGPMSSIKKFYWEPCYIFLWPSDGIWHFHSRKCMWKYHLQNGGNAVICGVHFRVSVFSQDLNDFHWFDPAHKHRLNFSKLMYAPVTTAKPTVSTTEKCVFLMMAWDGVYG